MDSGLETEGMRFSVLGGQGGLWSCKEGVKKLGSCKRHIGWLPDRWLQLTGKFAWECQEALLGGGVLSRFESLWIPSLFCVCLCACVFCCHLCCWATHDRWLVIRVSWCWSAAPFILSCLLFIPCQIVVCSLSFSVQCSPVSRLLHSTLLPPVTVRNSCYS